MLNDGIISKQWIGQDVEGSIPGQISDTHGICLMGLWKATIDLSGQAV